MGVTLADILAARTVIRGIADATPFVPSPIAFIVVYFFVFGSGTFYVMRLMSKRPRDRIGIEAIGPTRTAGIKALAANRPAPSPNLPSMLLESVKFLVRRQQEVSPWSRRLGIKNTST